MNPIGWVVFVSTLEQLYDLSGQLPITFTSTACRCTLRESISLTVNVPRITVSAGAMPWEMFPVEMRSPRQLR